MDERLELYHAEIPAFLLPFLDTPELRRLRAVGMNCGCEYTAFPLFRRLKPYSRYRHSLAAARIVWDFTGDAAQTLSTLFHDITAPAFAHSVDFLRGDHLRQEATEAGTEQLIRGSAAILPLLDRLGIAPDEVVDYHRYPIADNDAPRLSADRIEYTLGNLENYGFRSRGELQVYYDALTAAENEEGEIELSFRDRRTALAFGQDALRCSRVYVSKEDRYAMQMLAELLARAIGRGVLTDSDLLSTEPRVIALLLQDPSCAADWKRFRSLREMVSEESDAPIQDRRVVPAKKRCIDPYVAGEGRLSLLDPSFAAELDRFRSEPQDRWICGR